VSKGLGLGLGLGTTGLVNITAYATAIDFLLFIVKVQSFNVSSRLLVVERPDKKPCWYLVIKPCIRKKHDILR